MTGKPPITGEAVRKVFEVKCTRWNPPSAQHCEAIAGTIRHHVADRPRDRERRAETKANRESVRRLRAALVMDLPALAERVQPIMAAGEYAEALADLVAAAERFRALWPEPSRDARLALEWHAFAHTLAPMARFALAKANPRRRVGLPQSAQSPLAQALAGLLALSGFEATLATPTAIGRHFQGYWPGQK